MKAVAWIKAKWAWLVAGLMFLFWYFTRPKIVDRQIQISKDKMKQHEGWADDIVEQREVIAPQVQQTREDEITARTRVEKLSDEELAESFIRARNRQ